MILVLVGASASGKSSVEKCLSETCGISKITSYTTRPPRYNECNGVDYWFIPDYSFNQKKEQSMFVETNIYNNWSYGSALEDYNTSEDKVVVLTPSGLRKLKKTALKDNIISIYIKVPRRDRLIKMLERGDAIDECIRRNQTDVGMFNGVEDEVDYVIENHHYSKSVEEIVSEILKKLK